MVLRSRKRGKSRDRKRTFKRPRSSGVGDDFYEAVNGAWLSKTKIPPTASVYGVSEEIETTIEEDCWTILKSAPKQSVLGALTASVLDASTRQTALETVKRILCSLDTVNAGRVAEYIASQRSAGAQYIVVSHKPQVRVH